MSYTLVPTGTFRTTSYPAWPLQFEPSPWRPRGALCWGLKRKWTAVLWAWLDSMMTSPPRPPSPPLGPPRGTNFSLRKATHPLPPSPAFMRIFASSMNIQNLFHHGDTEARRKQMISENQKQGPNSKISENRNQNRYQNQHHKYKSPAVSEAFKSIHRELRNKIRVSVPPW